MYRSFKMYGVSWQEHKMQYNVEKCKVMLVQRSSVFVAQLRMVSRYKKCTYVWVKGIEANIAVTESD